MTCETGTKKEPQAPFPNIPDYFAPPFKRNSRDQALDILVAGFSWTGFAILWAGAKTYDGFVRLGDAKESLHIKLKQRATSFAQRLRTRLPR